jgi:hypothetical protein
MMKREREVTGYICLIDWEWEIGEAYDGNHVYPSVAALREAHPMADDCGIVEVSVRLVRVVSEGTGR